MIVIKPPPWVQNVLSGVLEPDPAALALIGPDGRLL